MHMLSFWGINKSRYHLRTGNVLISATVHGKGFGWTKKILARNPLVERKPMIQVEVLQLIQAVASVATVVLVVLTWQQKLGW